MKKCVNRVIAGILLGTMMLCGCGDKTEKNVKEEKGYKVPVRVKCRQSSRWFSEEGMLYVKDNLYCFLDFETQESYVLCSKINCPHRRLTVEEEQNGMEQCMAYVSYGELDNYAFMMDGKRYRVQNYYNGCTITVSGWDGSNSRVISKINGNVIDELVVVDEKLWMIVTETQDSFVIDDQKTTSFEKYVPCVVNLKNGEVIKGECTWVDTSEKLCYAKIQSVNPDYASIKLSTQENSIINSEASHQSESTYWRMHTDGNVEQIGENIIPKESHEIKDGAETIYYLIEDSAFCLNLKTGEQKAVEKKDVPYMITPTECYCYIYDENGKQIGIKGIAGEEREFYFPKGETFYFIVGNYAVFQCYLEDISVSENPLERRSVIRIYSLDDLLEQDYSQKTEIEGRVLEIHYWESDTEG